jgi:hypothetical protein
VQTIPVWDVTKANTVIGIGTALHKFTNITGLPVYLPETSIGTVFGSGS